MENKITKKEVVRILLKSLPKLRREYNLKRIGIFGSFALESQKADSDVDIIAEFTKPIGYKFVDFADCLEKLLGRKVDILTPAGMNSIKVKEVVKDIKEAIIYV